MLYAKVFRSLWDGSLRGQSDPILVFINLLTTCDYDGIADRSVKTISDETGLPENRVLSAITMLEAPDDASRSDEHEGRRIQRIDKHRSWGWKILNFVKYRDKYRDMVKKESNRIRQKRFRDRNNGISKSTNNKGEYNVDNAHNAPSRSSPHSLSATERISLDKAVTRGQSRLKELEAGRPYEDGAPQRQELKELRVSLKELKAKLGVPC